MNEQPKVNPIVGAPEGSNGEALPILTAQTPPQPHTAENAVGKAMAGSAPPSDSTADVGKAAVSAKKVEANRKNAQNSTGPRTEAGKAKAAANSYKHGFFAKRLFPTSEQAANDKSDYLGVANGIRNHYKPVGFMENLWVEKIATEALRYARIVGYENAVMMAWHYPFAHSAADRVLRYQTTAGRRLTEAIEELERLQAQRKTESASPEQTDSSATDTAAEPEEPTDEQPEVSASAAVESHGEQPEIPDSDSSPDESGGTNPPTIETRGATAGAPHEDTNGPQQRLDGLGSDSLPLGENAGTNPRKSLANLVTDELDEGGL